MSTKCTVLYDEDYHFYFDYKDNQYHLEYDNEVALQKFLNKVGNILASCPFSDAGICSLSLKSNKSKAIKPTRCDLLDKAKYTQLHMSAWAKGLWLKHYWKLNQIFYGIENVLNYDFDDRDCFMAQILAEFLYEGKHGIKI